MDLYAQGLKFRRAHEPRAPRIIKYKKRKFVKPALRFSKKREMSPWKKEQGKFLMYYFGMKINDATKSVQLMHPTMTLPEARDLAHKLSRSKDVREVFKTYAHRAATRIESIAENARSEKVKLEANLGIVDRAGFGIPKEAPTNNVLIIQIPEVIARKNGIPIDGTGDVKRID